MILSLPLLLAVPDPAAGEDLFIDFEGETLSARVEESTLKTVAEKIENETGIWFKAREALLQEKVSAAFDELPLEDGLERILSRMSYSLVYDDHNDIVGVFLFGSVDPSQKRVIRRPGTRGPPRNVPRPRTFPSRRPQPYRN
jgi:hypothetical protein